MAAGDTMQGRAAEGYEDFFAEDGTPKWWRVIREESDGATRVVFHTRHPGAGDHHGELSPRHDVTEHEDGTITVAPSILCNSCGWHGYLERGVWREV